MQDHKFIEIKITKSQKKNDPKNEDHKKIRINIMRSQCQVRPESQDHGIIAHGSNYYLSLDQKIKLFSYLRS